jgi:redox-sensitive bicupin YhaK (pirin superfamily)
LPEISRADVRLRILAGSAYGETSPVATFSPLFYVEATLPLGGRLEVPYEHAERAVFVVSGSVAVGETVLEADQLGVLVAGAQPAVCAQAQSRIVLLGGAALDGGPRHIWWNFVSSSRERIERAARDWQAGGFAKIPGDDIEHVPLPDWPHDIR